MVCCSCQIVTDDWRNWIKLFSRDPFRLPRVVDGRRRNMDRTQKYATEMTIDEFEAWAAGFILFGIGEGKSLQSLVSLVVNQAASNKVFGGLQLKQREELDSLKGMNPRAAVLGFLWLMRHCGPADMEYIIHCTFDAVATKAKDKAKAIRSTVHRLHDSGFVVCTNDLYGLSNKGLSLIGGKQ